MKNKTIAISLYTMIHREFIRMFRIAIQVFLPPIITMSLYFLIFGHLIGTRIGQMHGVDYSTYIAPGLIMMSVINNSYANVASSLFSSRFQKNIEEMLISPIPNWAILLGYTSGGVMRGMIIAIIVTIIANLFVALPLTHLWIAILTIFLTSFLFSLAGFTNAMLAQNFDSIAIIPTFVLTPLTYLGGVFFSINMLSTFWRNIANINPILYMVECFRYGMINISDIPITQSLWVLTGCVIILFLLNIHMMNKGIGLRT